MVDKKYIYTGLMALYFIVTVIIYQATENNDAQVVIFTLSPLFAIILGILALNSFGVNNIHGKANLFIIAGVTCWFLGEFLWLIYEIILEIDPYPSAADIFYLIGYPFLMIGIIFELKIGKLVPEKTNLMKNKIALIILSVLTAITLYFGVYLAYDSEISASENALGMTYGIGDLILLFAVLYLVQLSFQYKGGELFKSTLALAAGLVFTWFADILFAQYYDQYIEGGTLAIAMDYLWIIGYLLFAFYFMFQGEALDKIKKFAAPE